MKYLTPTNLTPGERYAARFIDPTTGKRDRFELEFTAASWTTQPHPSGIERLMVAEFDHGNIPEFVVAGSIRKVA